MPRREQLLHHPHLAARSRLNRSASVAACRAYRRSRSCERRCDDTMRSGISSCSPCSARRFSSSSALRRFRLDCSRPLVAQRRHRRLLLAAAAIRVGREGAALRHRSRRPPQPWRPRCRCRHPARRRVTSRRMSIAAAISPTAAHHRCATNSTATAHHQVKAANGYSKAESARCTTASRPRANEDGARPAGASCSAEIALELLALHIVERHVRRQPMVERASGSRATRSASTRLRRWRPTKGRPCRRCRRRDGRRCSRRGARRPLLRLSRSSRATRDDHATRRRAGSSRPASTSSSSAPPRASGHPPESRALGGPAEGSVDEPAGKPTLGATNLTFPVTAAGSRHRQRDHIAAQRRVAVQRAEDSEPPDGVRRWPGLPPPGSAGAVPARRDTPSSDRLERKVPPVGSKIRPLPPPRLPPRRRRRRHPPPQPQRRCCCADRARP